MSTYAKRLGLVRLLVAVALALASYATVAGGSMQGMDHGSEETEAEEGADHGTMDHDSMNDGTEAASGTVRRPRRALKSRRG